MSAPHLPPLQEALVDHEGRATIPQALWNQQLLQSRSQWSAYTPQITGLTGATVTAFYVQNGKTTFVRIQVHGTSDGTAPTVTLPFAAVALVGVAMVGMNTSSKEAQVCQIVNVAGGVANGLQFWRYDGALPTNLNVYTFNISGVYEAA